MVGEEVGEAGTKRACEVGSKGDLALVLDTVRIKRQDRVVSLQAGLQLKARIQYMMVPVIKRFTQVVGYLVRVPLKND